MPRLPNLHHLNPRLIQKLALSKYVVTPVALHDTVGKVGFRLPECVQGEGSALLRSWQCSPGGFPSNWPRRISFGGPSVPGKRTGYGDPQHIQGRCDARCQKWRRMWRASRQSSLLSGIPIAVWLLVATVEYEEHRCQGNVNEWPGE